MDKFIVQSDITFKNCNMMKLFRQWSRHRSHTTGVCGGIYYEGIYMVKVILTEIYMLEYFVEVFLLQSAITITK